MNCEHAREELTLIALQVHDTVKVERMEAISTGDVHALAYALIACAEKIGLRPEIELRCVQARLEYLKNATRATQEAHNEA